MAGGRGGKRERIEPRMGDEPKARDEFRVSREDRALPDVDEAEEAPAPRRKAKAAKDKPKTKPSRRRSLLGGLIYWAAVASVWCVVGLAGLVAYHFAQLPPIDQLAVPKRPPNIAILANDGSLLANRGDTGGAAVHLRELPAYLPKAFIAIEDRRFYSHFGIDPVGIARAAARNVLKRGSGVQGGSTLTQQLAKNLFLTQERTVSRKMQEAILALWLEHKYSKDQILELYLNRVYFGAGAYGIEAAARKYFSKSARQLTLAESAVLAGLMVAPTKLAPNRNPNGAAERASLVITAMAQEGHITEAMAKLALSNPAGAVRDNAGSINYAADYVMDVLDETVGAIDEDIVVTTTLNPVFQAAAEKALTDELDAKGVKFGVSQGAIVSLDPNGAIRALVGGRNYSESQFNRAVAAKRQPGSSFKPFVYLTALEKGLTPDAVREDAPLNVKGWKPENYTREYFGRITLTQALAMSLNTVAVRLGMEVGPKEVAKTAHRLGIGSELQANASLALGTSEVTPLELVTAYAPFANGGIGVQPHIITRVRSADGKQIYVRKGSSLGRLIEPQYVAMMNAMMQETLLTGTGRKAELPGWQAAGKTGTSQDFRDAWFVGYTSQIVTGVWLGNDDNSPTKKVTGGNLPVEIWSRYMKVAHQGVPVSGLPSGSWRSPVTAPPPATIPVAGDLPARDPAGGQVPAPQPGAAPQQRVTGIDKLLGASPQPARASAPQQRRADGAPVPPGVIPGGASEADENPFNAPREKSFFGKLFGG